MQRENEYWKVVSRTSTAGGEQAAANATRVPVVHSHRGIVAPLMVGITGARQRTDGRGDITDDNYGRRLENLGADETAWAVA